MSTSATPPAASPSPAASHYATVLGREIHFTEWGDPQAPVLLAAHGLARTGRDMDELASWFCGRYRVICPDAIGRGLSQWSARPDDEYCLAFYVRHVTALLDALGVDRTAWVGTSMGGAIGTVAAAGALRGRITHLVLNDNAPQLAAEAIARIRAYAGNPAAFDTMTELERYFRNVYKPYGWLSDQAWRRLAQTSARRLPDGRVTTHYDPQIVRQFHRERDDYLIWDEYDSLSIPVLCLRGAESDLVLRETTEQMKQRGPRAQVVEIAGCGHAPALNTPEQLGLIDQFLQG
jgi:pimeloyl-ACP methyl ester carboxylesterase